MDASCYQFLTTKSDYKLNDFKAFHNICFLFQSSQINQFFLFSLVSRPQKMPTLKPRHAVMTTTFEVTSHLSNCIEIKGTFWYMCVCVFVCVNLMFMYLIPKTNFTNCSIAHVVHSMSRICSSILPKHIFENFNFFLPTCKRFKV